jgi:hypothetical protein
VWSVCDAVVEGLDVLEDLRAELSTGRPGAAMDELLLERGEEALGDRVIERVADRADEASTPASIRRRVKAKLKYWRPLS